MMFGHDDHHDDEHKNNGPAPDGVLAPDNVAEPVAPPALPNDDDAAGDFIMTDTPTAMPQNEDKSAMGDDTVVPAPPVVAKTAPSSVSGENGDLLHIKQEAMNALSPLLDHLDQTPEEKFRTTMMMIQAADNDKLIPVAYEAAKAIPDEKARAQALLDIVNEINYFTQAADADKA